MPEPAATRPAARLRCESCLDVLTLRHHWDTATCSCGALMLSGRPHKPAVHWLSGPGRGWSELDDAPPLDADDGERSPTAPPPGPDDAGPGAVRTLGYVDVGASGP